MLGNIRYLEEPVSFDDPPFFFLHTLIHKQ